jgi:Predicted nucleotide-binding protein containing TIR-like domain
MEIGITGSWREEDREVWSLRSDRDVFARACETLGTALAIRGMQIVVGTDSAFTPGRYVVDGYLSIARGNSDSRRGSIRVISPAREKMPFADLYECSPELFIYLPTDHASTQHVRQRFIAEIGAMITIGGGGGTYQIGLEMKLAKKRLVPIGAFGGASARLLRGLLDSVAAHQLDNLVRLNNPWVPDMASHVLTALGADEPSRILLIHGHAVDRLLLKDWLQNEQLAHPIVMGQEFTAGQTLPEKFEVLATQADAAIALATPDDLGQAVLQPGEQRQRARQNVWVEVGWFWGRLGRPRVLLLVRGDLEIPSDLDGIEYHRYQSSPLEVSELLRKFLQRLSRQNQ